MRFLSVVLLLALLSASSVRAQPRSPQNAGVVRSAIEKVYYDVEGDTPGALAVELRRHGPQARGRGYFGLTEWKVDAAYRWDERPGTCTLGGLTVRVVVQTHLPRWRRPPHAPRSLSGAWRRFLAALDLHEHGHRALAEEAAEALRRRLASLRASTCGRIETRARQEILTLLDEYERRNHAYDAATDHGRSQGAVWPPRP